MAAAGVALLAHLNYYDILLHGGKGAGQLDGILHQAVQLLVYGRDAPLADECHLEHIRHCPACRHRQYGAGQHCSHRHLQSALAHTAGNELRQCHPDDECRHYHRCVAVPAVRQLRHIARIHHSGTGTHHFLHALRGAQRNAPAQEDEPECLRGGTRPGRHTVPSTAQGYSTGDISGYDKRIHPCFHALHRRLCRDHLHHRQPRAGNALHLHLRRCAQGWTDAGTAATLHHHLRDGAGAADCNQQAGRTDEKRLM